MHVLTSLISKWLGLRKDQFTKIYQAMYLNAVVFIVPAWKPWFAATHLKQLERCQYRALRVMTGQLQTTPMETLRQEAGVCSMTAVMRQ